MEVIKKIKDLKIIEQKRPIALIPTMGNLHDGHLSLIKKANNLKLNSLVTIFVNPLQFGPDEDFEKYPRTTFEDITKLEKQNCDFLYLPDKTELLSGIKNLKAPLSDYLCGNKRPGHFDGVITIVNRFLELINPEYCLFGQKDFQQQLIIKNHLKKNNFSTELILGPTVRNANGLALSSRNNYLSHRERNHASLIFKYLNQIADDLKKYKSNNKKNFLSKASNLCEKYREKFEEKGFEIDYLEIVNAKNLKKLSEEDSDLLIAISAFFKNVRLIDNLNLKLPPS